MILLNKRRIKNLVKRSISGQILLILKHKGEFRKVEPAFCGKLNQLKKMFVHLGNGDLCEGDFFYYYIDTDYYLTRGDHMLSNMPVDYSKVVNQGLKKLRKSMINMESEDAESTARINPVKKQNIKLIDMMMDYVSYMIKRFESIGTKNALRHKANFQLMLEQPAQNLEDAFQRILLWNQFIWQSGHNLMGFGRLDKLLENAYEAGLKAGENSEEVIREFLVTSHKFYDYKSAALRGDTGQVIVLGGLEEDGNYFYNDLTIFFLNILRDIHLPDPKIILRVSKQTPDEVWNPAVETICSGIGNPLLSNDDIIVPAMCEYYKNATVGYNYATTACWSPVALGNSISQCNPIMIQMVKPLIVVINSIEDEKIDSVFKTFEDVMEAYYQAFDTYITSYVKEVNNIEWEIDPIISFFTDGCEKNGIDVSEGGSTYTDYGMQSIGFPNLINSLMNLKKFVYDKKKYNLSDVKYFLNNNYEGVEGECLRREARNNNARFGTDDEEVLRFTNEVIHRLSEIIGTKRNKYGQGFKFGISSATFIQHGNETPSTFDGRKNGEPLGVQISSDIGASHTSVANFAAGLDYNSIFSNGNVVDLIINRSMISDGYKNMEQFLKTCIEIGVFQIQLNILSLEELIDAKEHPERHKDLIVRVWGFNSYFNDLPEEYKDLMIERARRVA